MLPNELRRIIPVPQPEAQEIFARYHTTSQFYRETQARQSLARYCDWYYTTGERHRQELQQMRGELNIMGWFRRKKR